MYVYECVVKIVNYSTIVLKMEIKNVTTTILLKFVPKNSKNVLLQYQHSTTTVPGVRRRKCRHRRCRRSSGRQSSGCRAEAYADPSSHHETGVAGAAAAAADAAAVAVGDGCAGGQHQPREATAEDSRRAGEGESWRTPRKDTHLQ